MPGTQNHTRSGRNGLSSKTLTTGRRKAPVVSRRGLESNLKKLFKASGYVRLAHRELREKLGQKYKKGYEVRFVLSTKTELNQARQWLSQMGFKPGKPFAKHRRVVQPVYGRAAVEWFLFGKALT